MLDKKIVELAQDRIPLELADQSTALHVEIRRVKEEMAARGMGRSGVLLKKITDICCAGIRKRAQLAWEVLLKIITTSGVSSSDDLPEKLKSIVDVYLPQSHGYVKNFIWDYAKVLDPSKSESVDHPQLDQSREIALRKVHNEIDLFSINLRNKEKISRQKSSPKTRYEDQMNMFEDILLEPVQEDLLITIVEADRSTPLDKRQKFLVAQSSGGDSLVHPSIPNEKRQIYFGDVESLARESLVALGYGSKGTANFDVTPLGFKYYEFLKGRLGQSVERIEKTAKSYIDAQNFQGNYPKAFEKWSAAEELLWRTDSQQQLTTIGHLCREAVQEFADSLVDRYSPPGVTNDKSKTIARLKAVFDLKSKQLGKTKKPFLDALIAYWGTVNDLVQRQVHGGKREGQSLIWEDARLVVFQTLIVMFEIDRAL